jgi:hypothetical protein
VVQSATFLDITDSSIVSSPIPGIAYDLEFCIIPTTLSSLFEVKIEYQSSPIFSQQNLTLRPESTGCFIASSVTIPRQPGSCDQSGTLRVGITHQSGDAAQFSPLTTPVPLTCFQWVSPSFPSECPAVCGAVQQSEPYQCKTFDATHRTGSSTLMIVHVCLLGLALTMRSATVPALLHVQVVLHVRLIDMSR